MSENEYDETLVPDEWVLEKILKELRESQGMTISELSATINLPSEIIKQLESGEQNISFGIFEKIAKAYDMTTAEILNDNSLFDEYIPPQFDGDVNAFLAFKKAVDEDNI